MQTTKTNTTLNASELENFRIKFQNHSFLKNNESSALLQGLIEDLIDGILVVTEQRELIYANDSARRVLQKLNQGKYHATLVPREIWHICQYLIQSRSLFPSQH